jgi:hypothetical protein
MQGTDGPGEFSSDSGLHRKIVHMRWWLASLHGHGETYTIFSRLRSGIGKENIFCETAGRRQVLLLNVGRYCPDGNFSPGKLQVAIARWNERGGTCI